MNCVARPKYLSNQFYHHIWKNWGSNNRNTIYINVSNKGMIKFNLPTTYAVKMAILSHDFWQRSCFGGFYQADLKISKGCLQV